MTTNTGFLYASEAIDLIMRAGEYAAAQREPDSANSFDSEQRRGESAEAQP